MSSFTAWRGTLPFFLLPQLVLKMFFQPRKVWGIVTIIIVIITIIIAYAVLQNSLLKILKALIILPRARQTIWYQDSWSSCIMAPDVVHKTRQTTWNKVSAKKKRLFGAHYRVVLLHRNQSPIHPFSIPSSSWVWGHRVEPLSQGEGRLTPWTRC